MNLKKNCSDNNINLIHTPPYWPQANGEVENMNKAILKRLQIAHTNNNDYRTELQKFVLMYNVTPQGTTGKSPSELLYNRVIRDKIPSINELLGYANVDEEAKDNDILKKQKGKEREDKARGAKEIDVKKGDKVLVKNLISSNKLTPKFDNNEYEVIERHGNEVTLLREGKIMRRHISHIKQIPEVLQSGPQPLTPKTNLQKETEASAQSFQTPAGMSPSTAEKQTRELPEDGAGREENDFQIKPLKLKKMDGMWRPVSE